MVLLVVIVLVVAVVPPQMPAVLIVISARWLSLRDSCCDIFIAGITKRRADSDISWDYIATLVIVAYQLITKVHGLLEVLRVVDLKKQTAFSDIYTVSYNNTADALKVAIGIEENSTRTEDELMFKTHPRPPLFIIALLVGTRLAKSSVLTFFRSTPVACLLQSTKHCIASYCRH